MTGLDLTQFKNLIIRPALDCLRLQSEAAVNLVTATALVESSLCYLQQMEDGPAIGLFQMEPRTHDDLYENFLNFRPDLLQKMQLIAGCSKPSAIEMIHNLLYAAAMCRLCYLRAKDPLPEASDALALAVYHKVHYNTIAGKADIKRNLPLFEAAIHA
ncbi:hypothetical protein FAI40_04780 [Acetobacteraceae bacterium]|nr:hypothetical protein FAI40_04780 [Acetobacteraceae bacterium]